MNDNISIPKLSNWFIQTANERQISLSPTKLLYYLIQTHLWLLHKYEVSPMSEIIETWDRGPMFSSHFHEYKDKWNQPIEFPSRRQPELEPSEELSQFLTHIWNTYQRYTDRQITRILTNEESFWYQWNNSMSPKLKSPIENEFLQRYIKDTFAHS